jgi:hypothetical protein
VSLAGYAAVVTPVLDDADSVELFLMRQKGRTFLLRVRALDRNAWLVRLAANGATVTAIALPPIPTKIRVPEAVFGPSWSATRGL